MTPPLEQSQALARPLQGIVWTLLAVTAALAVFNVLWGLLATGVVSSVTALVLAWSVRCVRGGRLNDGATLAFYSIACGILAFMWVAKGTRDYSIAGVPALIFAGCVFLDRVRYWGLALLLCGGVSAIGVAEVLGLRQAHAPVATTWSAMVNLWIILGGTAVGGRALMEGVQASFARERELSGALRVTSDRMARIFRSSQDAIVISSLKDGTYVDVNDAYLTLFGYAREEVIGKSALLLGVWEEPLERQRFVKILEASKRVREFEARLRKKNGDVIEVLLSGELQDVDGLPCVVISTSDVTARRKAERRAEYLMTRDATTGLPNRALALDRLYRLIESSKPGGEWIAVAMVGIDRFKRVNEAGSRGAGDAVLRETGERLRPLAGDDGTLARVGGDEFLLIARVAPGLRSVESLAGQIVRRFEQPFNIGSQVYRLTASAGVSLHPNDAVEAEKLIQFADTALRAAKDEQRGGYRLFEQIMGERLRDRLKIESRLRESIGGGTLWLAYQPKFDLRTRALTGMEVLSRWHHPELGEVAPSTFIGIAEESGLINDLGAWVLDSACAQLADWKKEGLRTVPLAINLSARQLDSKLPALLASTAARHGVAPGLLEMEVTETVLIARPESARRVLEQIAHNGNRVLLDDFGVGYSSLSYVKQLHIDGIKIDRSFVEEIGESRQDRAIVSAIAGLAHGLGLHVVAEGVESAEQLDVLRELGCDEAQGFHLCRPQPCDAVAREYLRHPAGQAAAGTVH
ncbi:MAG: EAL domain-containing protein [Betaproteobacteria bacterium]|nr:EAL domain-containing protein [Betaproteobacteria bacterium]